MARRRKGRVKRAVKKAAKAVRRKAKRATRKYTPRKRRRYSMARRKYTRRRSSGMSISLTDLGYMIALADTLGLVDAVSTVQQGGTISQGIGEVRAKAGDLSTYVNIGITTAVYGLTKKVFGGRTLVNLGGKLRIKT